MHKFSQISCNANAHTARPQMFVHARLPTKASISTQMGNNINSSIPKAEHNHFPLADLNNKFIS